MIFFKTVIVSLRIHYGGKMVRFVSLFEYLWYIWYEQSFFDLCGKCLQTNHLEVWYSGVHKLLPMWWMSNELWTVSVPLKHLKKNTFVYIRSTKTILTEQILERQVTWTSDHSAPYTPEWIHWSDTERQFNNPLFPFSAGEISTRHVHL